MSARIAVLIAAWSLLTAASSGCSHETAEAAPPDSSTSTAKQSTADPSYGEAGKEVDPVKLNGPTFVDWPRPKLAMVFTGELTGYIEPCGCAGLANLKGGLSRRQSLLDKLRSEGWPVVAFDLGGQVKRVGSVQTEIKYQATIKGFVEMGYAAVGLGADDLRMPAATLLGAALEPVNGKTLPLTSANVAIFGFASGATERYRIVEVAGYKIGVTAVIGDTYRKTINNQGITILPVDDALNEIIPKLEAEKCYGHILLCFAEPEETTAIAQRFPQFQYVVTAGGAEEPPAQIEVIKGTHAGLVEVGRKGQFASVVAFFDDAKTPVRYQRVPLDARFPESPAMKQLLTEYQDQLRVAGFTNLGVTEKLSPHHDPANPLADKYVGSKSCQKCHAAAYGVWDASGHAHATETLVKLQPPRNFDPECLSCHVTGWDPQQYVPFVSGFLNLKETPQLTGNGCENCHGPGAAHVAAETGKDAKLQETFRKLMHADLANVERTTCAKCHDHDNSPEFKFDTYWPMIEH